MCSFHILVAPSPQTGCSGRLIHLVQRLRPHTPKIVIGYADLKSKRERERERRDERGEMRERKREKRGRK
jgi:hypothetical protein